MIKRGIVWALVLGLFFSLGACSDQKDQEAKGQSDKKAKAQTEQTAPLRTAHYIEEEVETIEEINHAIVLVQNNDAFIAVEVNRPEQVLEEELKNEIVGLVRSTDTNINNIYISQSQDFRSRLDLLARDIERNLPAKAIGDSFEQTVRRVFPELRNR